MINSPVPAYPSLTKFTAFVELKDFRGPTKKEYVRYVRKCGEHHQCDPLALSEDQLRAYFLFLRQEKRFGGSAMKLARCSLRAFFRDCHHVAGWTVFEEVRIAPPQSLPLVLCREEVAALLHAAQPLPARTSTHKSPQKNAPRFAARAELYRTCGVDLTQVPGIQSGTALVLLAELGPDFAERFPTAKHFGSWLGLCPDNRITGGKIMSSSTRDVKSRAATALRLAAQCLNKAQNYFGDLHRRWKARLGTPKAITAMAHKLARILWHLCKYREAFSPEVFRQAEEKMQRKKLARLHNNAADLGLKLVPAQ